MEIVSGNAKSRKRKGKQHQSTQASKRVRGVSSVAFHDITFTDPDIEGSSVTMLRSTFAPDIGVSTHKQVVSTSDTLTFNRVICTINTEMGHSSLTESSDVETGLIERDTMFLSAADRGKTKDVYKVSHSALHRNHK